MKLVIQRVNSASVVADGTETGKIGKGLVLLLGIEHGDSLEQAAQLAVKVAKLRLWPDLQDCSKQWASSVVDNGYMLLVISQFTLFATFKKPKPDFHQAMGGDTAKGLYEAFLERVRAEVGPENVQAGVFGAMMQVSLTNDGPVTVELVAAPAAPCPAAHSARPPATVTAAAAMRKVATAAGVGAGAGPEPQVPRVPNIEGAAEVEACLTLQPYIMGFWPSRADVELFERLQGPGTVAPPETPNLARWYEHMSSFSTRERAQWP